MVKDYKKHNIEFTCTEIGGLWSMYYQESMVLCFLKYFNHHLQDEGILPLAREALTVCKNRLNKIRNFLLQENFPIPAGFADADVNLAAPPLFHDVFALSFIYMMNRIQIINLSFTLTNNVRLDVLDCFTECMHTSTDLFNKAVKLMLSKGIYDRPPKINYPKEIDYVHKTSFFSGIIGEKRPLNAVELSEIFFNIERNYFGVLLMLGFIQVVKNKNIKEYLIKGKKISEKQINMFNDLLMQEELLGTVPVSMEVTESTIPPFSDKFILAVTNFLNSIDLTLISHALSVSMRTDLIANYSKYIAEILIYAKDGLDLMIEHNWLEQIPLATNRNELTRG